jgi:hypothetical protein
MVSGAYSTHIGEMRNVRKILIGNPEGKGRDHLEYIVEGRIILKFMLGNMVEECGLDSSRPGQRP